jgi:phospholipid-translocating ATPase
MSSNGKKVLVRRNNDVILRDFITALCLCNDVIPKKQQYVTIYEATSPDEIALVKFAEITGMNLMERTLDTITI